eukprot:4853039-Pleurochrysis_carterae.AAC.2
MSRKSVWRVVRLHLLSSCLHCERPRSRKEAPGWSFTLTRRCGRSWREAPPPRRGAHARVPVPHARDSGSTRSNSVSKRSKFRFHTLRFWFHTLEIPVPHARDSGSTRSSSGSTRSSSGSTRSKFRSHTLEFWFHTLEFWSRTLEF